MLIPESLKKKKKKKEKEKEKEKEEEEEERRREKKREERWRRRKGAYDLWYFKNKIHQKKIKTNEKEAIQCEKECLSFQCERKGIGRVKFGLSTRIRTSIK